MTISPVAAPMAAPTSAGPSGGPSTDFEALVQEHLGQEHLAEEGSGRLSGEEAAAMLEAASDPSAVPSDGLAALLAGMLASPRAGADGTPPEGNGHGTADSGTGASESARLLGGTPATMSTSAGAAPGVVLPGVPLGGSAATVVGPVVLALAGAGGGRADAPIDAADVSRAGDESAGAAVAAGSEQGDVALPDAAGSAMSSTANAGVTDGASPSRLGAVGVAGGTIHSSVAGEAPGGLTGPGSSAGATAGGATAGADALRGNPVADQVFGHVTRLVSRGDGTHRLMLRLHPADLGEVKVVLTVRDNTVDVTLSAGPAAREALRDGSPQLRALLELAGATTGQVVIRDHAGAATLSSTSSGGQQPGSQWGDRTDQNGDSRGNSGRDGAGLADNRADSGGSRSSQNGSRSLITGPQGTGPATSSTRSGPRAPGAATHTSTRLDLNL